jgi:DNA-binding winged helix-turn-helix (wHTH) protein
LVIKSAFDSYQICLEELLMIENAKKETAEAYDFAELRFYPTASKVICLKTHEEIFLRRNLSEFLLLLLNKPHEIVSYQELHEGLTGWTGYKEISQIKRTIHVTKGELARDLRSLREDFDLVESIPKKGYRLNTDVAAFFPNKTAEPEEVLENEEESFTDLNEKTKEEPPTLKLFGGHWRQVIFASAMYAALFVVALFLEIAYQFDDFKNLAFKLSIPVFLWIWVTSLGGLLAAWRLARKYAYFSFVCPVVVFLVGAVLLHFFLAAFLPAHPVTEAKFQTYPAPAAYLKNVFYFSTLGILFIALPLTAVFWLETEIAKGNKRVVAGLRKTRWRKLTFANALVLSPKLLLGLTLFFLLFSLMATAHLFENLRPSANLNFFMQLVWWRLFLYFALAAECLIWYWFSLNSLKARCFGLAV